ncbi:MAG TPA: PA14 domain-containing protein [Bryobacteraceae bacterium]|nr:PA14 domain-containing protein [Bryobacteraceae bacterium]
MACPWRILAAALVAAATVAAQGSGQAVPPVPGAPPAQTTPTTPPGDAPQAVFGITVVDNTGLEGKIYLMKPGSDGLPNFKKMKSVGSIYTTMLNIPSRSFTTGFPGITERFEWFAIDYTGRFWIEDPGFYLFALLSDDGSKLFIDGHEVIDNDGIHPATTVEGRVKLAVGVHRIRVEYFQGPRDRLALVLGVARPGGTWHVFNTSDFRPPNPDEGKQPATDASDGKRRK